MPRNEIKFHHYRELSALATWWKAVFLTPIWAFILIMPLGALVRTYAPHWAAGVFALMIGAGLVYFCRDLQRRFLIIADSKIYFGLGSYNLSSLRRIKIGYAYRFLNILPSRLTLDFEDNGQIIPIDLSLASLKWNDTEALLDLLSRRVSQLKIDEDVERVLRSSKPLVVAPINDPEHIEMKYHGMRLVKELPGVLENTIYEWSRIVGPVGTLLLSTPLWLYFNWTLFSTLRDYSNVAANQVFYNELVKFLTACSSVASTGVSQFQHLLSILTTSPLVTFGAGIIFAYGMFNFLVATFLSPNRLTINREELSLDMWAYLWSHNAATVKWSEVANVALKAPGDTADPSRWEIIFTSSNKKQLAKIPLSSVSSEDRIKLAYAVERFAPMSSVESQLTEALRPSLDKSYTELWLQSLSGQSTNLDPLEPENMLVKRYEIVRTLAVGGEGVAYLAYDHNFDLERAAIEPARGYKSTPDVVLKETLIPAFIDKEVQQQSVERFEREARLLKSLESEHIVGLRDYFIADRRCYLVLEYIKGHSLRQLVEERGALPTEQALELAGQMVDILTFLHAKQIIHRDFTPDNLILQEDGKLKLIDFNVAREYDNDGKTGTIVGKHAYVPPEQFRGKPCEASDIYAMGATLFFLATGEDPEPISQSSLPIVEGDSLTKLNNLIEKCTAMSLKNRFSSAIEIQIKTLPEASLETEEV